MKRNIKIISILLGSLLVCTPLIVKKTNAAFTSKDNINNIIDIGDVDIEVSEKFIPPDNWKGEDYDKQVQIQNNSKSDALIRVAIFPRWIDEKNETWSGDSKFAKLNYEDGNILANPIINPSEKWIDGKDGYYYYNSIVPKGELTSTLLKSVSASVPDTLKERYDGKSLIVDVKAEAIQATIDAYSEAWSNINDDGLLEMLDELCK